MITTYLTLQILFGSFGCGFEPPFKPMGCEKGEPVCICDTESNCYWIWTGCGR